MVQIKRYDRYTDSGDEWIGEMPERWKKIKLRWYLRCKSGDSLNNELVNKERGEMTIPVIGGNGIMGYTEEANIFSKTIAIGRVGALCGNVHLIDSDCWITDNSLYLNDYNMQIINMEYLFYVLKQLNLNQFSTATAQPLITGETIKQRIVLIPSLEEQTQITNFLDQKTAEIDSLISDKVRLISLLKEQRQAIITEAVTKGLNPEVKIKNSGVEWIGEVPEYWTIKKLKYVFSIKKVIKNDKSPKVLSLTQRGLKIKDLDNNEGQHAADYSKYQEVRRKDFVMNSMDLLTGFVDCSKYEGVTSPDYRVFVQRDDTQCHQYFLYYFQLCYWNRIFYGHGQGVSNLGRWRLQSDVFKEFPVPMPPVSEQLEISEFLTKKIAEIEEVIMDVENLIDILRQYRQSLIYEAVTGKIDVRNYTASELEVER